MLSRRLLLVSLGLLVGFAPGSLAAPAAAQVSAPVGSWTAYATSGAGTVTPIDTATNQPGPAVRVGSFAGAIAITPDGLTAYIATDGGVVPLDTATNTPGAPIPVTATSIAITPNGRTVWVTTPAGTLVPIPTATNRPGTPIQIGDRAAAVAITPSGSTAYVVGDFDPGTVVPVDLASRTAGPPIIVGNVPRGIAITPNGRTLYVTNTGQVWPIDTATNQAGTPINVGDLLFNIAISPNGRVAYVTDDRHQEVTQIDLVAGQAGTPIPGGYNGVAITPDGATAYAASDDGILPIDVATNTVGTPIPVSAGFVAITPDQAPDAEFTVRVGPHGSYTRFDASSSVAHTGSIVRYAWRFGDGTGATRGEPVVRHVYSRPGQYTVTLTVTDSAGTSTMKVFTGQTMSRNGGPTAVQRHTVQIP